MKPPIPQGVCLPRSPYSDRMKESGHLRASTDAVFRVGAVLVAVGTVASVVALLPLFLGLDALPVAVYLLCFLAPAGLGLILAALWWRARTRSARLRSSPFDHS
jgi:cadmium resistance protein CadD (predicted permease)